jgi:hypothetical protein
MKEIKCCFCEDETLLERYQNYLIHIHKDVFGLNSFVSFALLIENISYEITKLDFKLNLEILIKYCEDHTEKTIVDFFESLQTSTIENLIEILMGEEFVNREQIILEGFKHIPLEKKVLVFSYTCPYMIELLRANEASIEILAKNQMCLNKLFTIYDKLSNNLRELLLSRTISNLENLERSCTTGQSQLGEFLLILYDLSKKNFNSIFLSKIKSFKIQDSLNEILRTQNINLVNFLKIITISKNLNLPLWRKHIEKFIKDNFNNFDDKMLSMIFKILAISKQMSPDILNLIQFRMIKNLDNACTKTIGNLMQGLTFIKAQNLSIHFLQPLTEIVMNRSDRPEYSNIVSE